MTTYPCPDSVIDQHFAAQEKKHVMAETVAIQQRGRNMAKILTARELANILMGMPPDTEIWCDDGEDASGIYGPVIGLEYMNGEATLVFDETCTAEPAIGKPEGVA